MHTTEHLPTLTLDGPVEIEGWLAEEPRPSEIDESAVARDAILLIGAGGDNALHLAESFGNLRGEGGRPSHDVHAVDLKADAKVPHDYFYQVAPSGPEKLEGDKRLEELIASGVVHAVYLSLVPRLHLKEIIKYLDHVKNGRVDFVVVPKPAVQSVEEMRLVDAKVQEIKKHREGILPNYSADEDQFLFAHEHYKEKGAWHELRENLTETTRRLGRLRKIEFQIREGRTVEEEERLPAFAGGALEDFFPHVASLGLDVQNSINETGRYFIPNHHPDQKTEIKTAHYDINDDSNVPERIKKGDKLSHDVDSGFKIDIVTKIYDLADNSAHDLPIQWVAGKGLAEDRKEARLEFESPEGVRSVIRVDLRNNTLEIPESVADLFPHAVPDEATGRYIAEYDDNGYGYSVECGLNGGDPRKSFQSWEQARVVTKWQAVVKRHKPQTPTHYAHGDRPSWLP